MENELPAPLRDFIARHIASVEELEVLLLLHEDENREWTVADINGRLRSQELSIAKRLETLVALGLVAGGGGRYRFAAESEELASCVRLLALAYRERRVQVIEFIFSKPNENLLKFVRAFDLRRPS